MKKKSDEKVIKPIKGDIRLGTNLSLKEGVIVPGEDYYLRKLKIFKSAL